MHPDAYFVWSRSAVAVYLIGAIGGWLAALAYRRRKLEQLRLRLAAVPIEHRAEALVPLQHDWLRDTRSLVAPLLREFSSAGEVTPASAPDARGDEASPAEKTP